MIRPRSVFFSRKRETKLYKSHDHICFLLKTEFKCTAITKMLEISLRTLRRQMQEYGISKNMLLSTVTEAELDDIVMEITGNYHQMFIAD